MAYNTSISEAELIEKWRTWADLYKDNETPLVMQINHPGRQSMAGQGEKSFWTKSLAPSAVPLRLGRGFFAWVASAVGFGTPKAMTQQDIDEVTELFRGTARAAYKAGFAGVELHGAHGYLLAQFLSAKSNHRTDAYGGTPAKRAKFVVDIIRAVREATSPAFCVGIKLNSVDYQDEEALAGCIEQLKLIHAAGIDFLEISGGDYEDPMVSIPGTYLPWRGVEYAPRSIPSLTVRGRADDEGRSCRARGEERQDEGAGGILPRVRQGHPIYLLVSAAARNRRLPHAAGDGGGAGRGRLRHGRHRPARRAGPQSS